jgi:hypothetical protein
MRLYGRKRKSSRGLPNYWNESVIERIQRDARVDRETARAWFNEMLVFLERRESRRPRAVTTSGRPCRTAVPAMAAAAASSATCSAATRALAGRGTPGAGRATPEAVGPPAVAAVAEEAGLRCPP